MLTCTCKHTPYHTHRTAHHHNHIPCPLKHLSRSNSHLHNHTSTRMHKHTHTHTLSTYMDTFTLIFFLTWYKCATHSHNHIRTYIHHYHSHLTPTHSHKTTTQAHTRMCETLRVLPPFPTNDQIIFVAFFERWGRKISKKVQVLLFSKK